MATEDDDGTVTRGNTLQGMIEQAIRAALAERVRSCEPARVVKYDKDKQKADVKILVGDFHRDEEGSLITSSVPVVPSVPVWSLTGGGFTYTVPIQAGDNGTLGALFFVDRSMDRWLSGSGQEVVDPELYHRNALADAFFVPGLLPFGAPMNPGPPTDHATAGSISGVRVHFHDSTITIGDEDGNEDFIALAKKVKDTLDRLQTVLNVFFKTGGTVINEPGNGNPSALQAALITALVAAKITDSGPPDHTWPDDVGAEQGKAR